MPTSFESKFASIISKRNSKLYTSNKSIISFYLLFLSGIVLGVVAFFIGIQDTSAMNGTPIKEHIGYIFFDCKTISDHFINLLKISETDLSHIFFIFISGFTYFCFAVAGVIVFAKGFMFSFSALFLIEIQEQLPTVNMGFYIFIFILLKFLICSLAVFLASETYIFSYEFRAIKQNLSVLKRAPVTYKFIFTFAKTIGGILIVNFIYCLAVKSL